MAEEVARVSVDPQSELGRVLSAALDAQRPVLLDTGEIVYEVFVGCSEPAAAEDDAVARSIAGIRQAAGSWKDADLDAFNAFREERRKLHTRPPIQL